METYTVDYSIPQEDEMEQVLSIINTYISVDKLVMKNENWACFSPILSRNCNISAL